jgi:hypothetical protein
MALKFTKLSQPGSQPASTFARSVMTKDGQYLLAQVATSAYRSFKRTGVTWAQVNAASSFTSLKGNSIQGFMLSPDETKIAWSSNTTSTQSHFIATWDKVAGTLTLDTLDVSSTSASYSVAWHPSGNYVAFGTGNGGTTTSSILVYKKTGSNTWQQIVALSTGAANVGLGWNIAGTILLVGCTSTAFIRAYDWASETLTLRGTAAVDTQPATNSVRGIAVSPLDDSFVVVRNATPGYNFYKWNSGTGQGNIVASAESVGTQGIYGANAAWTSDGKHFAVPLGVTPWFYVYDYDTSAKTYALASDQSPQTDIAAATFGVSFADRPQPWASIPSAVSTLNIFYYTDHTAADLAESGYLPTSAAVLGVPWHATIAGSGYLPTSAAAAKQRTVATIAGSGYLPTSVAAVKPIYKFASLAAGYLPTSSAAVGLKYKITSVASTKKFTTAFTITETWHATSVAVSKAFIAAANVHIIDPASSVGVTKPFTAAALVSIFATVQGVLVTPAFIAAAEGSYGQAATGALVTRKFVAAGVVDVTLTASGILATPKFTAAGMVNAGLEVRVDGMLPKFWADAHVTTTPAADVTAVLVTRAFRSASRVKQRAKRKIIRVY